MPDAPGWSAEVESLGSEQNALGSVAWAEIRVSCAGTLDTPGSRFLVATSVWSPQHGRYAVTAVAVAVAKLEHGRDATYITAAGVEPCYDEAQSALLRANVLAPYKPRVDVVVVGRVYAPTGVDADRLVARIRLGDFTKAISVTGDRLWMRDNNRWTSSQPRPFSQMLLTPDRAIRSAENPVGLDPASIPIEGRLSLPNFEPVSGSFSAILGPVPSMAPSRRGTLSPEAAAWIAQLEHRSAIAAPPQGLNFGFFNLAPLDQQLLEAPAGVALVLENLHPREAMFTSRLPSSVPVLSGVDPGTHQPLDLRARCDTIWVDGDREVAMLVYRATAEISRPDLPVNVRVDLSEPAPAAPTFSQGMLTTQQGVLQQQGPMAVAGTGLPFSGVARPPVPVGAPNMAGQAMSGAYAQPTSDEHTSPLPSDSYPPPPAAPQAPQAIGSQPRERTITAEVAVASGAAMRPRQAGTLPFSTHGENLDLEHTATSLPDETPGPETLPPPAPVAAALPFGRSPAAEGAAGAALATPLATPPYAPHTPPSEAYIPPPPTTPAMRPEPMPDSTADQPAPGLPPGQRAKVGPVPDIGPTLAPELPVPPSAAPPPELVASTTPGPRPIAIPISAWQSAPSLQTTVLPTADAPAMPAPGVPSSGYVASASRALGGGGPTSQSSYSAGPPAFAAQAPAATGPAFAESYASAAPRQALTIEECAAVRAEISTRGCDKNATLGRYRLDEGVWNAIEKDHLKAIDEASKAGDVGLLERYDEAYVKAQDQLRVVVDRNVYAKLMVAKEQGELVRMLDEIGINRAELMRLERVWRRRLVLDRALADWFEDELERLRDGN